MVTHPRLASLGTNARSNFGPWSNPLHLHKIQVFILSKTVSATLTPEQNKRVRDAAQRLVDRYEGNISAAARALGKDQSWLNRVLKERAGASFETASLIARELQERISDLLELPDEPIVTWGELPGFSEALEQAKAASGVRYGAGIWATVASFSMPPHPARVEPWMLLQVAGLVESLSAKQLTAGSSVPPADGGHKKSQRKIRSSKAR
jgi:hypothetical protein